MKSENRFNLIDEQWIPVVNVGRVSLKQIFTNSSCRALGGNPVQKIAITKLLLAIAQSAYTPKDDEDWVALSAEGMAEKCVSYLEKWRDRFWLYGDRPFLQMPNIESAELQTFGAVAPDVATGNTTVFLQTHIERDLLDADRVLMIVALMGFGLGGKKTDNSVVLSPGYSGKNNDKGKPRTGSPGPSIGFMGFLHNFLVGQNLLQTIWINLLTHEQIVSSKVYSEGVGEAPWEKMPEGEACPVAQKLQKSLMGRLLPLSRFCLLRENGLNYSEGIAHLGYKDGVIDPTVAANFAGKIPKVIWVDPERKPWRQLTALLSFISQSETSRFDCYQIRCAMLRARQQLSKFGIWSGGLRVSSNAGEQYVSGSNDYVESSILLNNELLSEWWYERLKSEMTDLDELSKIVYDTTISFFKDQKSEGKKQANLASNLFWQLCERQFQNLIDACGDGQENEIQRKYLRKTFANIVQKSYDTFCAKDTVRQLDAWAKNRPNLRNYLKVNNQHDKEKQII